MANEFITWNDSYSVGIPLMDEQHKKLLVMINDLYKASQVQADEEGDSRNKAAFALACSKAADYAKNHFADEEKYMAQAAYPDLADQKKQHESYLSRVWAEFGKYEKGEASPLDLAMFLRDWLMQHIVAKDKLYTSYLSKLKM